MEKPIRHVHVRRFSAPRSEVVSLLDALWSGGADDSLPRAMHGWRRTPEGKTGLATGTRFGHGPFAFTVETWDGSLLRARIETRGFRGHHGFTVREEGAEVVVTHDLDAQLGLAQWLVWTALIGPGHDWAVQSMLERMQARLAQRTCPGTREPPLSLRVFMQLRRALARVAG